MGESDGKRDAKSLVSSILAGGKPTADATPAALEAALPETASTGQQSAEAERPDTPDPDEAPGQGARSEPEELSGDDAEATDLINVYFELEEPEERDAAFDQIVALRTPIVERFLRAVMQEDVDEYVRAAATAALTRRGDVEAVAVLATDLDDPEEPYFFENAVQVLSEVCGPAIYDRLAMLWRDPERDTDQRRESMLGMETADQARALADFVALVEGIDDITTMPDDQVEVAIMAFLRHGHREALPALAGLRERILAQVTDADERDELSGMVQEGIDLLSAC